MKLSSFLHFAAFGVKTILLRKKEPILGTVIVTDRCNLHCRHCSVNNTTARDYPYASIRQEMQTLYGEHPPGHGRQYLLLYGHQSD